MISKRILKIYDLSDKNQYFEMIYTSKINGQTKQTKAQYKVLSAAEREDFKTWFLNEQSAEAYNNFLNYLK